ncbi:hypothetical protein FRB95_012682 [Tulasnella sp. JGI-2019a]|nr:hypothetical protein FRB95_012682 [Tulasnella sp. JGI-2019a]
MVISDILEVPDLLMLLRTCRIMRTSVGYYLYRHINIYEEGFYYNRREVGSLLGTLKDRPDLAGFVLSLQVDHSLWGVADSRDSAFRSRESRVVRSLSLLRKTQKVSHEEELEMLLVAAPDNLVNLRHLRLVDHKQSSTAWTYLPLLNRSRFPSLTSLEFGHTCEVGTFDEMVSHLRHLPLLEHLALPCIFHQPPSSMDRTYWIPLSTDFLHLKSLAANLRDARKIIPGRQITSFEPLSFDWNPDIWRDLNRSTGPLTQISVSVNLLGVSITWQLRVLAENLKHIESLRLAWEHKVFLRSPGYQHRFSGAY